MHSEASPIFLIRAIPSYSRGLDESFTINDSVSTNNIIGVYAGDQIALLDNLHINAGARFDIFDQKVVNNAVAGILDASEDEQTKTGFSPSIGITYQPWKPLAIFANYTRSFLPQTAGTRSMDGRVFDPSYGSPV